ncbi:MAG: hypothetical protein LBD89_09160 [Tannerellaceae bacterium]|jgi:uncharacterized membrane protein|nr:hypothetical protein [Tannerellaceae bacterium]
MKRNDFNSVKAYRIYAKYIEQVKETIARLDKDDMQDIMSEIDSHIYESFISNKKILSEEERMETVIRHLGNPESYLRPILAEKQLKYAINKYNLWGILKGFAALLLTGGQYVTITILYLLILSGGILTIAKIFYPDKTGLFIEDGNFVGLGYLSGINAETIELLGYWLIPISVVSCVIFYFFITFILKKIVTIKTKLNLRNRGI